MDYRNLILAGVGATLVLAGAAYAQHQGHGGGMQHQTQAAPRGEAPSTTAFRAASTQMHQAMDIQYSGNADIDFVRGMIPHHEGAIAMARVLLEHGRDEQTRRWAQDVIREQQRARVEDKTAAYMDSEDGEIAVTLLKIFTPEGAVRRSTRAANGRASSRGTGR